MPSTYTQSLANGLVNFQNTGRILSHMLPNLDELKYAIPGDLSMGKDTDTWGLEILQAAHNTDIDDYQSPIISGRLNVTQDSVETIITSQKITRQLGFYSSHVKFDKATKQIKSGMIGSDMTKQIALAAVANVAKLFVRTFKGIDSVAANNIYAGSGTADSNQEEQIGIEDIIAAYYALANYDWQPFTTVRDVKNNYNMVEYPEYFVLTVHTDQVAGMLQNMLYGEHYIPRKDYDCKDPDEICRIVPVPVIVRKSKWVEKAAGGVATTGMKQTNSVNNIYHARMYAGESFAFPAMGKQLKVKIENVGGKQDAKYVHQGISVNTWPDPTFGPHDVDGKWNGATIQYWSGDTADGEGGILVPRYDDTGTARYGVAKIHATARDYGT